MNKVTEIAINYLDFPAIRYGSPRYGNTPVGFDCSGFVQYTLNEAGIYIPERVIKELLRIFLKKDIKIF